MSKALQLLSLLEGHSVTVALHDFGVPTTKGKQFINTDIFGFELWDVPSEDPIVADNKVAKNYVSLFSNLTVIEKKEIRKYNATKQRIGLERSRVEKVYIPDSVWSRLKISSPNADQKLFMQCLYILYKSYNVRIVGMSEMNRIEILWY